MPDEIEPAIRLLDTSFVLNILIGPPDSEIARHWRVWESHGDSFAAPELLGYEMSNAIWQLEKQQKSRETTALHALMRFEQMPIAFLNAVPDHTRALE